MKFSVHVGMCEWRDGGGGGGVRRIIIALSFSVIVVVLFWWCSEWRRRDIHQKFGYIWQRGSIVRIIHCHHPPSYSSGHVVVDDGHSESSPRKLANNSRSDPSTSPIGTLFASRPARKGRVRFRRQFHSDDDDVENDDVAI